MHCVSLYTVQTLSWTYSEYHIHYEAKPTLILKWYKESLFQTFIVLQTFKGQMDRDKAETPVSYDADDTKSLKILNVHILNIDVCIHYH